MDNYNPDLIFDLAAGLLPEEEARAAEGALTPAGRAELAAQRAVMAAIAAEPAAGMTDIERARMHRSVADGIAATTRELSPVAVAQPRTTKPSTSRWFRWASAATAAALFVGVVAVGSQLTSLGGSDSASDTTAAFNDVQSAAELDTSATTTAAAGALTTSTVAFEAPTGDGATEGADIEPPEVFSTSAKDDLASLASELQTAQRQSLTVQSLSTLGCFDEASADLAIVDWSFATYVDDNGTEIEAIGFAVLDGDGDKLDIQLYELATCDPIVTD